MGRQCNRNSFYPEKQLSVWFMCYCTKWQLRILELRVQKPEVQNIIIPEKYDSCPWKCLCGCCQGQQGHVLGWGEMGNFQQQLLIGETRRCCAETMLWSQGSGSARGLSVPRGGGSLCSLCASALGCAFLSQACLCATGKKINFCKSPSEQHSDQCRFCGRPLF